MELGEHEMTAVCAPDEGDVGSRRLQGRLGVALRVLAASFAGLLAAGLIADVTVHGFERLVLGLCAWTLALLLAVHAYRTALRRPATSAHRVAWLRAVLGAIGLMLLVGATVLAITEVTLQNDPFFAPAGSNCGTALDPVSTDGPIHPDSAEQMTALSMLEVDCELDIHWQQSNALFVLQCGLALCALAMVIRRPSPAELA